MRYTGQSHAPCPMPHAPRQTVPHIAKNCCKLRFRQRTRKSLWPSPVQNTHSYQNSWCDTIASAEGGFQLQAPQAGQIKLLVSLSLRQGIANTFLPKMRSTEPTCRSYHELRIPE